MNFNGNAITSIGFIPWTENAEYTLTVWMGENAEDLMLEQSIEAVEVQSWNDIVLDMPIPVDSSSYVWLGYEVVQQMGEFPAGCDFGPAAVGKGDLISTDGISWESLTYFGLSYNWSLRGFVDVEGENVVLSALPAQNEKYKNSGQLQHLEIEEPKNLFLKNEATTYNFLGYNLYRNGVLQNDDDLLSGSEYQDSNLLPGIYSYEVTAIYDLGESMPAGPVEVEILEPFTLPLGWLHQHTAMTHVIHIPTNNITASSFMSDGDWIGVFYNDNGVDKSAGAIRWSSSDSLKLIAFGDDPTTPEKEGFALGEWIKWKVYMADTGDEFELTANYNPMMPQWDGMFAMLGISALTDFNLLPTSVPEIDDDAIRLFPNPTSKGFTLVGIGAYKNLKIYTIFGQEIMQLSLNGERKIIIDAALKSGMYQVVLSGENTKVKKLLVR
jgi:hypothetical protein